MSVTETMGERIHNLRELRSLTRESLVTQMKIIDKDFAISLSSLSRLESNRSYSSRYLDILQKDLKENGEVSYVSIIDRKGKVILAQPGSPPVHTKRP